MKTAGITRKNRVLILSSIITLACCSVSQAVITSAQFLPSSCTNLTCSSWSFNGATDTLSMHGNQLSMNTGHILGNITTDTPGDPTLFLGGSVNNDTGYIWNGYQVNVIMSVPFTFSGSAGVANPPQNDWFVASTTGPTLQGSGQYANEYEGTILFSAGTALGVGAELDFNYAIHFASSTDYSFTQEMIPQYSLAPEPSTLVLVGMGALVLVLRLRRNTTKDA